VRDIEQLQAFLRASAASGREVVREAPRAGRRCRELCVLSPGDQTAMRVYERAGFTRVATMLHWSDE
jgi:hypothetical protein